MARARTRPVVPKMKSAADVAQRFALSLSAIAWQTDAVRIDTCWIVQHPLLKLTKSACVVVLHVLLENIATGVNV